MITTDRVIVEHALPHRVRLRVPLIACNHEACERIAAALAAALGTLEVAVRTVTGSVIVSDPERELDGQAIAQQLDAIVAADRDEEGRPLSRPAPGIEHPGPTRVARAVAHAVAGVNADVRAALDDHADLGTILPVFFAAAGVAEAATEHRLPVPTWFNLLWWSLRSFMTFNIRAVEDEVLEGEEPRVHPHDLSRAL